MEFDIVLNRNAFSWEQIVYISCLIDSYEFKLTCLNRQLHDVESMETGLFLIINFSSCFSYILTNYSFIK